MLLYVQHGPPTNVSYHTFYVPVNILFYPCTAVVRLIASLGAHKDLTCLLAGICYIPGMIVMFAL